MNTSDSQIAETPIRPRPKLGLGIALMGKEEEDLLIEVVRGRRPFRYSYDLKPEQQGAMTATLEREFCQRMGVKYALAVTSGTAALEVSLAAMGIGPGDEVIVPAWSWISCFTAIVRIGALPVLAEIDETFCLAPEEIERLATSRTKAVLVVHYQGVVADMDLILKAAQKLNLRVLEDCAESPGATYRGRRAGSMGDMGIYSFQAQKSMTSGEGGMIVTKDPILYERAVRMHDLGSFRPHHTFFVEPKELAFSGGQYRMNEMTAAVALAQLRKLEGIREYCRMLSARIIGRIASLEGVTLRRIPDNRGDSGFEIYFCLATEMLANKFNNELDALNVNCAKMTGTYCHYAREYCIHRNAHTPAASPFAKFSEWPANGYRAQDFPRTEDLVHRFVSLPLGVLYSVEDADYIAASVEAIHSKLNLRSIA